MARTVPYFACSGQEAGEETDKTGGALRRPCQDTPAAPIKVHPPVSGDLFDASGGVFRIPAGASGRVQGFAGKLRSSIKGALSAP